MVNQARNENPVTMLHKILFAGFVLMAMIGLFRSRKMDIAGPCDQLYPVDHFDIVIANILRGAHTNALRMIKHGFDNKQCVWANRVGDQKKLMLCPDLYAAPVERLLTIVPQMQGDRKAKNPLCDLSMQQQHELFAVAEAITQQFRNAEIKGDHGNAMRAFTH